MSLKGVYRGEAALIQESKIRGKVLSCRGRRTGAKDELAM